MNFKKLNEELKKFVESFTTSWEVVNEEGEAPYITCFVTEEPEDNLSPYQCIGSVQGDGTIYYYWMTNDGDEAKDEFDITEPSSNIFNKLKKAYKKYCQEAGEENPFELTNKNVQKEISRNLEDLTTINYKKNEIIEIDGDEFPDLKSLKGLPNRIKELLLYKIKFSTIGTTIDYIDKLIISWYVKLKSLKGIKEINKLDCSREGVKESFFKKQEDIPKINILFPLEPEDIFEDFGTEKLTSLMKTLLKVKNKINYVGIKKDADVNSECLLFNLTEVYSLAKEWAKLTQNHHHVHVFYTYLQSIEDTKQKIKQF